jgi:tetratricopeptide (TPR) repeat protein
MFHLELARALAILGKVDEAVAEADKAVDLAQDTERLRARLARVSVLTTVERFPQALAEARALLKENALPGSVRDIRLQLYFVYSSMRDLPRAEEQLRLILKADPDDATANNDLGYLWADQGKNLAEAERLIRKALELDAHQKKSGVLTGIDDDRENAAYVDSLGWVLFRRGNLQEALRYLEKAVALPDGADDPTVWDHLGDVCSQLHERERALAVWRQALTLHEKDQRRKKDDQYKELKRKLHLLGS